MTDNHLQITLMLECDPAPPFRSGHPDVAEPRTVEAVRDAKKALLERRTAASRVAASRLKD